MAATATQPGAPYWIARALHLIAYVMYLTTRVIYSTSVYYYIACTRVVSCHTCRYPLGGVLLLRDYLSFDSRHDNGMTTAYDLLTHLLAFDQVPWVNVRFQHPVRPHAHFSVTCQPVFVTLLLHLLHEGHSLVLVTHLLVRTSMKVYW